MSEIFLVLIKSVKLDGKVYALTSQGAESSKNNYSVIIGVNGVGKSRLLNQVVSSVMGVELVDEVPKGKTRLVELDSGGSFSIYGRSNDKASYALLDCYARRKCVDDLNVIAVTTSPFDRFPVPYRSRNKFRYRDDERFHYIGLRVSENNFNKTNLLNLFSRSLLKSGMCRSFKNVFRLLNYNNKVRIEFKSKISSDVIRRLYANVGRYSKGSAQKEYVLKVLGSVSEALVEKIKDDNQMISNVVKSVAKNFSSGNKSVLIDKPVDAKTDLIFLLDMGVIQVKRIELYSKSGRVVDFSESSSGEQCVLLSILNLAGVIRDNSIVCIDEPEISLHPSWQRLYVKLLQDCFRQYKGCHFIISTHSPLIVSELDSMDCHVLNMAVNEVYAASDYAHQSVDFQLATVFDTPGDNNEYLKRRAVTLLSKNSRVAGLSEAEHQEARDLISRGERLSEKDVVKQLISLLERGVKARGNNA